MKCTKKNFVAALSGLAYCRGNSRAMYDNLKRAGVIAAAIRLQDIEAHAREIVFQRLALAILSGDELADGESLSVALQSDAVDGLAGMIDYLSRASLGGGDTAAKGNVLRLWKEVDVWAANQSSRRPILSRLCGLLGHVDHIDREIYELAQRAIGAIDDHYEVVTVVTELDRLFVTSPQFVIDLIRILISAKLIAYDHEDRLKAFFRKAYPSYVKDVLAFANDLRRIRGMTELIRELESSG